MLRTGTFLIAALGLLQACRPQEEFGVGRLCGPEAPCRGFLSCLEGRCAPLGEVDAVGPPYASSFDAATQSLDVVADVPLVSPPDPERADAARGTNQVGDSSIPTSARDAPGECSVDARPDAKLAADSGGDTPSEIRATDASRPPNKWTFAIENRFSSGITNLVLGVDFWTGAGNSLHDDLNLSFGNYVWTGDCAVTLDGEGAYFDPVYRGGAFRGHFLGLSGCTLHSATPTLFVEQTDSRPFKGLCFDITFEIDGQQYFDWACAPDDLTTVAADSHVATFRLSPSPVGDYLRLQ